MQISRIIEHNEGQAIAEALVSIAMLGMILLASATLYQIMQADINANKAARVAAWHGVLYQGETQEQFEDRVRDNIDDTLLARPVRDVINNGAADLVGPAEEIAFEHETVNPTYTYPSNRSSFIANQAGLNENRVSGISISIPLSNDAEIFKLINPTGITSYTTTDSPIPYDPIDDSYRFHVKAGAALLSNGFVPLNEAAFSDAISRISSDGNPMTFFEVWRNGLNLMGFDEIDAAMGEEGLSTVSDEQSRVLPTQLGTFTN